MAVNVDTSESDVSCISAAETVLLFRGAEFMVAESEADLLDAVEVVPFWAIVLVYHLTGGPRPFSA